jgi:ferric-dicitrate binding protein FerR (iron transport regulator)
MRLQVLGTSFNIKAYKDEETITTTLITGKVEQFYPKIQQQILLTPSQQSTYNRTNQKLKTQIVNTSEALAWREGKIIANDERLEDIFKQLTRWYDFDVVYTSPELKDIRFHFQSKRYTEIQTILEHFQTTKGIRFSYIGNTVYISK